MHTVSQHVTTTEYMRLREAASFINMSPAFLRKEARLGRGPERVRCGKVLLYPMAGLRRYMTERTEKAAV